MRLLIPCRKCVQEGKLLSSGLLTNAELRDDGYYELTCPSGHTTAVALQQQKFEILFDLGAHAILDGYYREAISSFTSSLERFYEFAVRIFLEKSTVSDEVFQSVWKEVSNQSERQFGAFMLLWAVNFKENPSSPSQCMVKLRNKVIHKGMIPTREEAVKYGNKVLEILTPKIELLKEGFKDQIINSNFRQITSCAKTKEAGKDISIPTMFVPTIIGMNFGEPCDHIKTLEQHLISLHERKQIFGV